MERIGALIKDIWSSLTVRVLVLLTLTMAPIGAIAFYQNARLTEALSDRAVGGLLAATVESITSERAALERAIGAADALSVAIQGNFNNRADCVRTFNRVIDTEMGYVFAGIVTPNGVVCSPDEDTEALSDLIAGHASFERRSPFVVVGRVPGADQPVSIVGQPVRVDGAISHYVLLRLSSPFFTLTSDATSGEVPEAVAILSSDGTVIRSSLGIERLNEQLPADRALAALVSGDGYTFTAENGLGVARTYSIVPVYRDAIYAIAAWDPRVAALPGVGATVAPWLFPIAMWLATLAISYIAISRLVVRHVKHLGWRMRRFARTKALQAAQPGTFQPTEFSEMNENFVAMAEAILQDEAELEDAVHERTLLLREVHHRVKNNLQLIASIMNMQIRRSRNTETAAILRRLQDRVLGLAAIHRQMYRADTLDRVPADEVVDAVLSQTVRFEPSDNVTFTRNLASVPLLPDQAVPLALLTAEVATNAVSFIEANAEGVAELTVDLEEIEDGRVTLTVTNTVGQGGEIVNLDGEKKGLGTQLIDAFARQLGGTLTQSLEAERYLVSVTFRRSTFEAGEDGGDADVEEEEAGGAEDAASEGGEPGFPLASAASARV